MSPNPRSITKAGGMLALAGALLALGAGPAAAATRHAHVLVDRAPRSTAFADRVLPKRSSTAARAAAALPSVTVPTAEGYALTVTFADGLKADKAVATSYVQFLDSLTHGPELAKLTVEIAPSANMDTDCGGRPGDGILACYGDRDATMIVPSGEVQNAGNGITTSYVIAHEYGHHVAANRSNAPFASLDYGPKRWASYELVCKRADEGLLFPGVEQGNNYFSNPGEEWAEAYARLKYPSMSWTFDPLLEPDAGALAAARADVLRPWTSGVTKTFRGTFARGSSAKARSYRFDLTLDGAFSVRLRGPKGSQYDLSVRSSAGSNDTTSTPGSQDAVSYRTACREQRTERITVSVKRRSGSGAFTVTAAYAG